MSSPATAAYGKSAITPNIRSFLIVRMSAMGDILHAMPAVAALRNAFPNATIGWLVEERWRELVSFARRRDSVNHETQSLFVDKIHTVNTKKWRTALASKSTRHELVKAVQEIREMKYEVAIDFQGLLRSAVFAKLSRARTIYGFDQPREGVARYLYNGRMVPTGDHIVEQNLSLAEFAAKSKLASTDINFFPDETIKRDCERWLKEHNIEKFVMLNPGAGWASKQWPAERYGQLARSLNAMGLKSLINAGPSERPLAQIVKEESEGAAEVIDCPIPQLIVFTRRASLFVGGDTGPTHLAAALKIPVVGIYGPTNPSRNGPYGTRNIVLRSQLSATNHGRRAELDPGLLEITTAQVIEACKKLLGGADA